MTWESSDDGAFRIRRSSSEPDTQVRKIKDSPVELNPHFVLSCPAFKIFDSPQVLDLSSLFTKERNIRDGDTTRWTAQGNGRWSIL